MQRTTDNAMRVAPVLAALLTLTLLSPAPAVGEDEARWNALRGMLFQDRPIHDGAGVLTLDAPYRAHDAATVPIRVEPAFPQTAERHIRTVTLLIDENPLPLAGRFHFTPASGRAVVQHPRAGQRLHQHPRHRRDQRRQALHDQALS